MELELELVLELRSVEPSTIHQDASDYAEDSADQMVPQVQHHLLLRKGQRHCLEFECAKDQPEAQTVWTSEQTAWERGQDVEWGQQEVESQAEEADACLAQQERVLVVVQQQEAQDSPPQDEAQATLAEQEAQEAALRPKEGCRHCTEVEWAGGREREGQRTSS